MSTQSVLFGLRITAPIVDAKGYVTTSGRQWFISLQYLLPLVTVDTSAGNQVEKLPPAGLNTATGQSNQNMEITYRKITRDANTVTINGSEDGAVVLTAGDGSAASRAKFKSDGTNWWRTG